MRRAREAKQKKRPGAVTALLLAPSALGLLLMPSARTIPHYRKREMDGIVTIEDAVRVCAQSGCSGWDLVAYAQRLVSRKFVYYSLRNMWDRPARAFAQGMGYCSQYNLALKEVLKALGFEVKSVFCTRVSFVDKPEWRLGHTWLRVRVHNEWRDVCASRVKNEPGIISFVPLRPVYPGHDVVLFILHMAMIVYLGVIEWRACLTGKPLPEWMMAPRG